MAVLYRFCYLPTASIITILLLIFSLSVSSTQTPTHRKLGEGMKAQGEDPRFSGIVMTRRRLNGLGSWPPSCRSKCGQCLPCYPVHIAIHPGFTIPLQYYPEAWRCKCGNTMYTP